MALSKVTAFVLSQLGIFVSLYMHCTCVWLPMPALVFPHSRKKLLSDSILGRASGPQVDPYLLTMDTNTALEIDYR